LKEPVADPNRRTGMTTHAVPTLTTLALLVLVGGCGTREAADGVDQARASGNPAPTATPTPAPTTDPPSGPPWPTYDVEDYTFTLRVRCFCPDAGIPVTVTVTDGKAVDAVFAKKGSRPAGAPAPAWRRVTINDVIDTANDPDADTIKVRWPAGQDYPTSVWVDRDTDAIDEEIGYTIRNVDPA
jgi:Family of unknown function (DUF6174)